MTSSLPLHFTARVIRGAGRGRVMGTPTLNLDLRDVPKDLKHGIYACLIDAPDLLEKSLQAAVHYGPRPVFADTDSFEVHLLDTVLEHPPLSLGVEVIAYLREVRNFPSVEELQTQISDDIAKTREILKVYPL